MGIEVMDHDLIDSRLRSAGIPVVPTTTADSRAGVADAFARIDGRPVVLKAGGLLHQSAVGGVVLDLVDADRAVSAAGAILGRHGPAALPFVLQQQARGMEILVGARRDPQLGPALVVGLGGTCTSSPGGWTRSAPRPPSRRCWRVPPRSSR